MKSQAKILFFFLVITFLKDLLWSSAIPIWQGPDEQAHFAQVQYYVEKKTLALNPLKNRSLEVTISEKLLGTLRNGQGNNKFTYHPEFKIENKFEAVKQISHLPISTRSHMVAQEAASYPPLYYILAYPFYLLAYFGNLFDRIYAVRLLSIILHVATVYVAYKIGKLVWQRNFFALSLGALVAFQPMLTFLGATVHPDNLLNLLYSLAILFTLLILKQGVKIKSLLILGVLYYLGYETKILMVFLLPVTGAVIFYKLFPWKIALPTGLALLLSPLAALFVQAPIPLMPVVSAQSPLASMSVTNYMKFRIPKLLFEVWPWYWTVFKWLGVVLPIQILRIITRVAVVLAAGIVIELVKNPTKYLIFFLISSFSFLLYLIFWDYRLMQSIGWSQGLQGRYLFPNIIPHMALLIFGTLGLSRIIPFKKSKYVLIGLLVVMMISLNIVAYLTLIESYN